jgi:hypothetical protein
MLSCRVAVCCAAPREPGQPAFEKSPRSPTWANMEHPNLRHLTVIAFAGLSSRRMRPQRANQLTRAHPKANLQVRRRCGYPINPKLERVRKAYFDPVLLGQDVSSYDLFIFILVCYSLEGSSRQ